MSGLASGPAAPGQAGPEPSSVDPRFTGLSAFPLTPLREDAVDEEAFSHLVRRLAAAGVDSITVLGSTGSYAYLSAPERARVAELAVQQAGQTPVFVGIGALRTSQVLAHAASAQAAGAQGLLLAPVSYQPLTSEDVFQFYRDVTEATDLPVIVYDNPGTTHFAFTPELYARIAQLPGIASLKIPGVPGDPEAAREHVARLRALLPEHVGLGVSGDAFGARGLAAGCEAWYSVTAGTFPAPMLAMVRAAQAGETAAAQRLSEQWNPWWELFAEQGGSLRVVAAAAEELGLVPSHCLPRPLLGLGEQPRARIRKVLRELGIPAAADQQAGDAS